MNRHSIALALRRARLIGPAYQLAMRANFVINIPSNRRFRRDHPGLAMPPASLMFETQTATDYERYWSGGRERANFVMNLFDQHLPSGPLRVCEWGCGPGRVIRHLPTFEGERTVEAFGTDYSPESIEWCSAHIPDVTFRLNSLEPPLPFEDNAFDALYSFSVYTHLAPDLQRLWLAENLRVVRPGGIVLFTVHGDSYRSRLVGNELEEYERTGVVVRAGVDEGGPWFTTYQSPEQVERELVKDSEILHREVYESGHSRQDVWAVRKPEQEVDDSMRSNHLSAPS
jgi:SAM-dependent methyltransferase